MIQALEWRLDCRVLGAAREPQRRDCNVLPGGL
jgi:hypothetical protein